MNYNLNFMVRTHQLGLVISGLFHFFFLRSKTELILIGTKTFSWGQTHVQYGIIYYFINYTHVQQINRVRIIYDLKLQSTCVAHLIFAWLSAASVTNRLYKCGVDYSILCEIQNLKNKKEKRKKECGKKKRWAWVVLKRRMEH